MDLAPNLPFEMSLKPLHKLKQFSKINNFIGPTIPCSLDSSQLKKANIYVVVHFNCAEMMNELMKGNFAIINEPLTGQQYHAVWIAHG